MMRTYPEAAEGALPDDCRWIDLIDPTPDEVALVRDRFGFDVPTQAVLEEIEATSRLRSRDGILYMSAPLISGISTDHWQVAPTGFILSADHCVTVRFAELDAFDSAIEDIRHRANISAPEVLVRLLEEVVDRAADHLERAAESVSQASHAVFFDELKTRRLSRNTALLHDTMRKIGRASDRASRVRYAFLSIGRIASFVIDRCEAKFAEPVRDRFDAVRHDIASLDEFETSLAGRIQFLQDAAAGFINIEQNEVVKVLTVVSVVGVPPVLVVGIYGMNFKYMPELQWHLGYPFAILLCILSAVLPLLWFRWRDWI
jgi:magnesium transporter